MYEWGAEFGFVVGDQEIRPACPAKSSDSTAHVPISLTPFGAPHSSVLTC